MKRITIWAVGAIATIGALLVHLGCASQSGAAESAALSERMAESIMKRNPDPWMMDGKDKPVWTYTIGLVLTSFEQLAERTGNQKYLDYLEKYTDAMIEESGEINDYDIDEFNIDHINPGKILFRLYETTKEEKYKKAIDKLRRQMQWQPRTSEGGFWHKLRYPWQMWLDGAYMGSPFLAQYAKVFNEPELFDDVTRQIILLEKYTRDEETGLLYHAWDESRIQRWSDPETGLSPHFWGRAMGWYGMAIVDILDYLPEDHADRDELIAILDRLAAAVTDFQDEETGLWYQVVDLAGREENYLEASASSMFVYTLAKGVRKDYLDNKYMEVAEKGYNGIVEELIREDEDGGISLTQVCSVAGLGGRPYRDGSFEYYMSEKVVANDPKGTGPFILASLEFEN